MGHWASSYIGKPWQACARGPDVFDCFGLVWWIQQQHFHRDCPLYDVLCPADTLVAARAISHAMSEKSTPWAAIPKPIDGCVVAMGQSKAMHHVGVYLALDGGRVLHCMDRDGVILQKLSALPVYGWHRVEFYTHTSWPT